MGNAATGCWLLLLLLLLRLAITLSESVWRHSILDLSIEP
jgi:hypothetical protein